MAPERNTSIRPRLRASLKMIAGGLVAIAISAALYGWVTVAVLAPIGLIAAAGYYVRAAGTATWAR